MLRICVAAAPVKPVSIYWAVGAGQRRAKPAHASTAASQDILHGTENAQHVKRSAQGVENWPLQVPANAVPRRRLLDKAEDNSVKGSENRRRTGP